MQIDSSVRWLWLLLILVAVACTPGTVPTPGETVSASAAATPSPLPAAAATPTLIPLPSPVQTVPRTAKPNIVFILTDDMAFTDLEVMPNVKRLLTEQGVLFQRYFLNVTLCCPSRTSILRGQYNHNTQVFGNQSPRGGWGKFHSSGEESDTAAVWLRAAGYRTMLAGKYLNGYPDRREPLYVPPGWDEWYSASKGNAYSEFNYTLNENGNPVSYGTGAEDYGTDVYGRKSVDFIRRSAQAGTPFFAYIAVYAPHGPATPAPRHASLFADVRLPRPPNFDEPDVSDKPQHIRNLPRLSPRQIAQLEDTHRKRLQSLQAVDEMVATLVNVLRESGQLSNTYIFFSSDNGFHLGNHRMPGGKTSAYEEDIRVPLIVRGPGVPAGRTEDALAGNIDRAPTWLEIAGAVPPQFVDGRSLLPLWRTPVSATWRQAYVIQHGDPLTAKVPRARSQPTPAPGTDEPPDVDDAVTASAGRRPEFYALRGLDYTYVEYVTGERELYDLRADPYQLTNLARGAKPATLKLLSGRLAELAKCSGAACRQLEDLPLALPR